MELTTLELTLLGVGCMSLGAFLHHKWIEYRYGDDDEDYEEDYR